MRIFAKLCIAIILSSLILVACTTAKLEARLEANPQCKEVVNPKTGAAMPCPGTDKSFYRSVGLDPAKSSAQVNAVATTPVIGDSAAKSSSSVPTESIKASSSNGSQQMDCKPQLHKKTGGMLPCPSPN